MAFTLRGTTGIIALTVSATVYLGRPTAWQASAVLVVVLIASLTELTISAGVSFLTAAYYQVIGVITAAMLIAAGWHAGYISHAFVIILMVTR